MLPACFHRLPIYTFVGKLFAESGENSAFGPTTDVQYSFQRIETFGGGRIRKKKRKRKESLDWKTKSRKNKENNEVGEARYKGGKDAYIHRTRASNAKYKSGTKKKKRPSSR